MSGTRRHKGSVQTVTCDDNNVFYPALDMSGVVTTSGSGGETIIQSTTVTNTIIKELLAGTGISLSSTNDVVTITNTQGIEDISMTALAGISPFSDTTGNIVVKTVSAGTGISLVDNGTFITINNTSPFTGSVVFSDAAGATGESVIVDGIGGGITLSTLVAGSGITITGGGTANLTISAPGTAGGTVTLSPAGVGTSSLVADGTGPTLSLASFSVAGKITTAATTPTYTIRDFGWKVVDTNGVHPPVTGIATINNSTGARTTAIGDITIPAAARVDCVGIGLSGSTLDNSSAVLVGGASYLSGMNSVVIGHRMRSAADNSVIIGTNNNTLPHVTASRSVVFSTTPAFDSSPTVAHPIDLSFLAATHNAAGTRQNLLYADANRCLVYGKLLPRQNWAAFTTVGVHSILPIQMWSYLAFTAGATLSFALATAADMYLAAGLVDPAWWGVNKGGVFYIRNATGGPKNLGSNTGWSLFTDDGAPLTHPWTLSLVDGRTHMFQWGIISSTEFRIHHIGRFTT